MYIFLIVVQVVISLLLIVIILMQRGRGGGLVESLTGAESIFGTKTNVFLVRTTAILATLFLLNCLAMTYLSVQRNKSLMEKQDILQEKETAVIDSTEGQRAKEEQAAEDIMSLPGEAEKSELQEKSEEFNIKEPEEIEKSEEEIDNNESQAKE